ncbi:hypothetical protein VQ042_06560 [Aurantimonas sp. A2-1-M11]|uniref:hypothetical protein n=1 Tax=Aurantimonas sp. A2-1-M11 TaxID=3113712 RepID=UPI002F95083F
MSGTREKWDGTKPRLPQSKNDEKGRQEKKTGEGKEPEFDGPSTDADDAKHDGP